MTTTTSPDTISQPTGPVHALIHFVGWCATLGLIAVCYANFFTGTYFAQDDFIWLCFSKFHPTPWDVLWTNSLCGQFYRPLGQLWWVLVYRLGGDNVVVYQVAFLVVHLINAILVGRLVRRLVSPAAELLAFPFFLMNPLFVARISIYYCFIFDTLGLLFFLGSVLLLLNGLDHGRRWACLASLVLGLAAFFCKEAYFTLPGVLVLTVGLNQDRDWEWHRLKSAGIWLTMHVLVWISALSWRYSVIGSFGGYGLARTDDASNIANHLIDRLVTLISLSGWSISPHLARWNREDLWPVLASAVVCLALSVWVWRWNIRPRIWWVWTWVLMTWSPSLVMTTFAPVSFYTPMVATTLLLSTIFTQSVRSALIGPVFVAYFAFWGFGYYRERGQIVQDLRHQESKLNLTFGAGRELQPGDRVMLLNGNLDLMPDPIMKYHSAVEMPVADVLFVNTQSTVGWVICNDDGPGQIAPMRVSLDYQSGEMPIGRLKAVPLEFRSHWMEIVRQGKPFRFFKWRDDDWNEIFPENSSRTNGLDDQ